jgi:hypothetical protein
VNFTFAPTRKDHYGVQGLIVHRLFLHRLFFWFLVALPLLFAAEILVLSQSVEELINTGPFWTSLVMCWGVAFVGFPLVDRWAVRQMLKGNPAVYGPHTFEFTAEGFRVRSGLGESSVPWGTILEVRETVKFLLFFYTKSCAFFLPKRVIAPAELTTLKTLLREHVVGSLILED